MPTFFVRIFWHTVFVFLVKKSVGKAESGGVQMFYLFFFLEHMFYFWQRRPFLSEFFWHTMLEFLVKKFLRDSESGGGTSTSQTNTTFFV
jgi:hypothetical protein